jgi:hypothetical protein
MTAPLDKLHDFYQSSPPAWTPQTIGWYVVFVLFGLLIVWLIFRTVRHWMRNRYRREALRELAATSPDQFSTLLKRTALAVWPRERVASLNGKAWLTFLSETAADGAFHHAPGSLIEDIALRSTLLSAADEQTLRQLTANWIRRHRVQT